MTDQREKPFSELNDELLSLIETAQPRLRDVSTEDSAEPIPSGGWSMRRVIGHPVDSASNNPQGFVQAALQESLEFPGPGQDGSVGVEEVQNADWELMVSLWAAYNRYLAT